MKESLRADSFILYPSAFILHPWQIPGTFCRTHPPYSRYGARYLGSRAAGSLRSEEYERMTKLHFHLTSLIAIGVLAAVAAPSLAQKSATKSSGKTAMHKAMLSGG